MFISLKPAIKVIVTALHIETSFFGVLCWDQNIESSLQLTRILRRSIWNFIPKWSAHVIVVWNFLYWLVWPFRCLIFNRVRCYCSRTRALNGMCQDRIDFDQRAGHLGLPKSNRRRPPRQFKSVKIEMWRVSRPGNVTKVWWGLTRILQLWETRIIVWKSKGF